MSVRRPIAAAIPVMLALTLSACSDLVDGAVPVVTVESVSNGPVTNAGERSPATSSPTAVSTTTEPPVVTAEPLPSVRLDLPESPGGFARTQGLTGGFGRAEFVITSTDDRGPGTYRDALSEGQRNIRFDPSLDGSTIELDDPVVVGGDDITLDGSGVDVTISRSATRFTGTNIVVAGMTYRSLDRSDDQDALTFLDASETQVVGLFGNVFATAADGLVDLIWNRGNDVFVTACGNRFERHDKAMLIHSGRNGREGGRYRVTLCHNLWSDVYQRTPLSRDADVHQYNSVFERYGKPDGDGGGSKSGGDGDAQAQHLLERNVATPRAAGETTFDGTTVSAPRAEWAGPQLGGDGDVRATGTLLETTGDVTATEIEHEPDRVFAPPYDYSAVPASPSMRDAVAANAGRCVPVGGRVVPCAPLVLLVPGAEVAAVVEGEAAAVDLEIGGAVVAAGTDAGDGRWTFVIGSELVEVGELRAVAVSRGGTRVASEPFVGAIVAAAP